ncbi:trypsin-1-like [Phymastichus coffea]|uniref:trypsin-1-like n=1 Tax=Phymastichus coffea TaxID=108790 RepID=UPI00273C9477|nr:trypsin-1-like [Phymastichus coffea]
MPFKVIVLCCLLAIANAGPRVSNWMPPLISTVGFPNKVTRVVGGNNAEVGEFPHQISLQYILSGVMTHICGGSIISEKWILTAGHCVFGLGEVSSFFVKAGKHNIMLEEDSEQKALIEDIFIHENYTGSKTAIVFYAYVITRNVAPFDIALLKLKVPLKFNKRIAPIRLPAESGVEPVGYATVSGWGSISLTVNSTMPAILQKVKILIIDFKTCYAALLLSGEESKLHNTNFCTGPLNGGLGACQVKTI